MLRSKNVFLFLKNIYWTIAQMYDTFDTDIYVYPKTFQRTWC